MPSVTEIMDALDGLMEFSSDDPPETIEDIRQILASYMEHNEDVVRRVLARLDGAFRDPPIAFQEVRDRWL